MKELVVITVFSLVIVLNSMMYDLIYDIVNRKIIKRIIMLFGAIFICSSFILVMLMILKQMN